MLLGDMGAEVIKIEDPRHGDDTREWAPFVDGWSTYFLGVNRNKKSVAIDLKSADGVAQLEALIRSADVLVENFRPGHARAARVRPRSRAGAERAADLLLDLRLRRDRAPSRFTRIRHGDPGRVGADGRDGIPRDRADEGWSRDHRLPRGALRRAGNPARAHLARAHGQGTVRRHRAARFRGLDPRPACRNRRGDRQESRAARATRTRRSRLTSPFRLRTATSSWPSRIRACGRSSARRSARKRSSTTSGLRPTATGWRTARC